MYIVAGLGNPTLRYRHTRHNAGFDALDVIAKKYRIPIKKKEHFALTGIGTIQSQKVLLVKPQTYMNRSGESLRSILSHYGESPEKSLLVLVDDIMLSPGMIRIRAKGSSGGHNGLKNIIETCHTENFSRIRIGVGKLPAQADMIRFVLSRPKGEDAKRLRASFEDVARACELLLSGDLQKAMNDFNGKQRG